MNLIKTRRLRADEYDNKKLFTPVKQPKNKKELVVLLSNVL